MKRIGTYAIIALVAIALGAFLAFKIRDKREPEIIIKRDTITIVEIDSTPIIIIDTVKIKSKPVVIKVPEIYRDTVVVRDSIETTMYTGIDSLSNGIVDWTIYADNLQARQFKLTTEKEYVTETITKILPPKSRLYLSTGLDANLKTKIPQAAELGLMYNRRQKWGAGAVIRHDFSGSYEPNAGSTFGLRVFIGI
jgi:hypothetical protein